MGAYNIVNPTRLVAGQPEDVGDVYANLQAIQAVLNGGIDNTNIAVAAAIAKSKLAALGIVNADVDAAAAIAASKIAGGVGAQLICDLALAAPQASFDTNTILGGNIPSNYSHLRLVLLLREDDAIGNTNAQMRFNNDFTGVYNWGYAQISAANAASGSGVVADTGFKNIPCLGTGGVAGRFHASVIDIPNYAGIIAHKVITGVGNFDLDNTLANLTSRTFTGTWRSTAAVARIQLGTNAGNFIAGSRFTLYGMA